MKTSYVNMQQYLASLVWSAALGPYVSILYSSTVLETPSYYYPVSETVNGLLRGMNTMISLESGSK